MMSIATQTRVVHGQLEELRGVVGNRAPSMTRTLAADAVRHSHLFHDLVFGTSRSSARLTLLDQRFCMSCSMLQVPFHDLHDGWWCNRRLRWAGQKCRAR